MAYFIPRIEVHFIDFRYILQNNNQEYERNSEIKREFGDNK
jgi:hypothetical protein